jgi:hypothetical protein
MATITIVFPNPLNVSVQVGDTAYYMKSAQNIGTNTEHSKAHTHSTQGDIIQIGEIVSIDQAAYSITCTWDPVPTGSSYPGVGVFIMFSKDNKANLSSVLGYYAKVKLRNNSKTEAELFSVGTEFFESSK